MTTRQWVEWQESLAALRWFGMDASGIARLGHPAAIVAVCAATAALAGCGSGSAPGLSSTQRPVAAKRPALSANASNLDVGRGRQQLSDRARRSSQKATGSSDKAGRSQRKRAQSSEKARPSKVSRGTNGQKARQQGDNDEYVVVRQINPCRLVSLREARVITGGAVTSRQEAPLGPTCVYRLAHRKADITLAVEGASYSRATRPMTTGQRLKINGRKAYCGELGSPTLFVRLSGQQLLHVTAPCPIAQQFAAKALRRLSA